MMSAGFWKGDFPLSIDDAMPGNPRLRRKAVQCITDKSRLTVEIAQFCNLAVGGNFAFRDLTDGLNNELVIILGPRIFKHRRIVIQIYVTMH